MMADTIQIQQIILNLGRNALEAMGEGVSNPHRLTIRFTMPTAGRDGHVDA